MEPTSSTQQKPIHSLVLDTGPLIKNIISISTLINSAEELYTTPDILREVRDEATRSRVQTTLVPFLKIRTPSPASYDAVVEFSKKTGDHAVLSKQDLGILALAYEVHCEKNGGTWGLREVPKGESQTVEKVEEKVEEKVQEQVQEQLQEQLGEQGLIEKSAAVEVSSANIHVEQNAELAVTPEHTAQQEPSEAPPQEPLENEMSSLSITQQPTPPTTDSEAADSDSDGDWITPTNLSAHQAADSNLQPHVQTASKPPQLDLATMTTDHAMQNVLLQLNLTLLSPSLQRIKTVTSKIHRCHACFLLTKEMTRQFCPRCGQPTLQRVSCSTNAKGEFRIHLSKTYTYNKRGDRYSIPKPIAGTANTKWKEGSGGGKGGWGRELILAEDQKEFLKVKEEGRRRKARDALDEDFLPGILTGERVEKNGKVRVGAGRDVNAKKRS
ncbi:Nin one binding Zn-ribbon like-domain-containing protein [Bipolaris maydis]|uniref:Nin one binding Zn-ribbon like-domain-containing protein n=1 Tax=Cochliobolus heterostrophus TaxID=5016 RepID=UPI0024D9E9EB|nr:Nin one binding Zn-ribbon like-domain-containing protein [Bipolaris maydis]